LPCTPLLLAVIPLADLLKHLVKFVL